MPFHVFDIDTEHAGSQIPIDEINRLLLTDAAQSVLDMGYQPDMIKKAIEKVLIRDGKLKSKQKIKIIILNKFAFLNIVGSTINVYGISCIIFAELIYPFMEILFPQIRSPVQSIFFSILN